MASSASIAPFQACGPEHAQHPDQALRSLPSHQRPRPPPSVSPSRVRLHPPSSAPRTQYYKTHPPPAPPAPPASPPQRCNSHQLRQVPSRRASASASQRKPRAATDSDETSLGPPLRADVHLRALRRAVIAPHHKAGLPPRFRAHHLPLLPQPPRTQRPPAHLRRPPRLSRRPPPASAAASSSAAPSARTATSSSGRTVRRPSATTAAAPRPWSPLLRPPRSWRLTPAAPGATFAATHQPYRPRERCIESRCRRGHLFVDIEYQSPDIHS